MSPFAYHISLHTVMVLGAMAAVAIIYTYGVSYIWAMWRLHQRKEKPAMHNTFETGEEVSD